MNLKPMAKILGWADAEQAPTKFTTTPALAIPKALKHAKVEQGQIDAFEVNEAFSVVALANMKLLGLDPENQRARRGCGVGSPVGSQWRKDPDDIAGSFAAEEGQAGVCRHL